MEDTSDDTLTSQPPVNYEHNIFNTRLRPLSRHGQPTAITNDIFLPTQPPLPKVIHVSSKYEAKPFDAVDENGDNSTVGDDNEFSGKNDSSENRGKKSYVHWVILAILVVVLLVTAAVIVPVIVVILDSDSTTNHHEEQRAPEANNVSATYALVTFYNNFGNLSQDATFSVFVGISGSDMTNLDDTYTWASVQNMDSHPPYVSIFRCDDFFILGTNCENAIRVKRETPQSSITVIIGGDTTCDEGSPNVYCNGPLRPNTEYQCVLRVYDIDRIIDSDVSELFRTGEIGTWSPWSEWGACDSSCGGGLQRRYKQCENGVECIGVASQSQRCNRHSCPRTVLYGSWEAWTGWTECTTTCGTGQKIRTRQCDEGPDGNLTCPGDWSRTILCAEWSCPDCGYTCPPDRILDNACVHCQCNGHSVEGKVISQDGIPLHQVEIYLSLHPVSTLSVTSPNGFFTLNSICEDDSILFMKTGFLPAVFNASSIDGNITLERIESLFMDLNPSSKMRVAGDDVQFCCSASGNPMPDYYEWFHDDVHIQDANGSTFVIHNVSTVDAGYYKCKANTESSALYSDAALLTVREDPDDFCSTIPEDKYQQLPQGCVLNGQTVYNVGKCERLKCHDGSSSDETCQNSQRYCCAGSNYETVNIDCDGFTYAVKKVVSCGCYPCIEPVIEIQGFVLAADTNNPLPDVTIYWNETAVSDTNVNGQFYVQVPKDLKRVVLTAKSEHNSSYADGVGIISLGDDPDGVYYTTILLRSVTALPSINTNVDNILTLNGQSDELLSISIPAGSVYDEAGNLYTGDVTPYVSVIDPRDESALESSPGDFTTVNELGEEELLQSYGMFAISLLGSDGTRLQVPSEIEIEIPATVFGIAHTELNNINNIKLYILNAGRWEVESTITDVVTSRRRKRQVNTYTATIPGITVSYVWRNFDAVSRTTCYSKIRAHTDDSFDVNQILYGVFVRVYVEADDGTHSLSTRRAFGDIDSDGICVVHRCDSPRNSQRNNYKGYITATYRGKFLVPANYTDDRFDDFNYFAHSDRIETKFWLRSTDNGPFHDWSSKWRYSPNCRDAQITQPHFQFYLHEQCYQHEEQTFQQTPPSICNTDYYMSWHSTTEINNRAYKSCFIKVKAPNNYPKIKVQAISRVGTMAVGIDIGSGDVYGYREDCVDDGYVCVEIKPPGQRGCTNSNVGIQNDSYTLVDVRAILNGNTYDITEVTSGFEEEFDVLRNQSIFTFEFTDMLFGDLGVFCSTDKDTANLAVEDAKGLCQASPDNQYAVSFGIDFSIIRPRDCADVYIAGITTDGVYTIQPDHYSAFEAYCDMTTSGGGWTVFQRRYNGSQDFYQNWHNYKVGFGSLTAEHWLGLEKVHYLTERNGRDDTFRVDLMDFSEGTAWEQYTGFNIASEGANFALTFTEGSHTGTAGDSLSYHQGRPYNTYDHDPDGGTNYASYFGGAWWYLNSHYCALNHPYHNYAYNNHGAIVWRGFHFDIALKETAMKLRPSDYCNYVDSC